MKLTEFERESATWKKLSAHLDETIAKHQRSLEKTTLSHEQTLVLRGEVKALRKLQNLGNPSATDPGTENEYR